MATRLFPSIRYRTETVEPISIGPSRSVEGVSTNGKSIGLLLLVLSTRKVASILVTTPLTACEAVSFHGAGFAMQSTAGATGLAVKASADPAIAPANTNAASI